LIPVVDLKAQYRGIKTEIDEAVLRVLDSSQFILGDEVTAFERDFARFCRTGDAIGLNSGTSALHLALLAAGVGRGDEVITVPFTFIATTRSSPRLRRLSTPAPARCSSTSTP
jgi:dTDP-4-amino-4,6-dideoxygalactose transaminase